MRLCFLILSAPYKPWDALIETCAKKTWIRELHDRHLFFTYTGKPMGTFKQKIVNDFLKSRRTKIFWRDNILPLPNAYFSSPNNISVELVEAWDTMTRKFLSSISLINQVFDYDFLVRVNTTTYVNVQQLEHELAKFKGTNYWGGAVGGKPFTRGWATVLSKSVVRSLLNKLSDSKALGTKGKYEDEAIGQLISTIVEKPNPINCIEINHQSDLAQSTFEKVPFVRIKTNIDRLKYEPELFEAIHKKMGYR